MFWQSENLLSSVSIDSETESLQTDIQRFIAILGFCLMAIFALVQSIEVTVPMDKLVIEDLSRKMTNQIEDLKHLESKNLRLKKENDLLRQYRDISKDLSNDLEQARKFLIRQKEQISKLLQEKIEHQVNLFAYKQVLNRRDREIRNLRKEMIRVEKLLNKAVETVKKAAKLKPKKELLEQMQKKRQKVSMAKTANKEGVYVAFESDQVLMDLLAAKEVYLYINIIGMEKGFRVIERNGTIEFESNNPAPDLDLWEVGKDLLPAQITSSFQAWTTLSSRKKMFIIGLTRGISKQIRDRNETNGRFIIKSGGSVTFSKFGD